MATFNNDLAGLSDRVVDTDHRTETIEPVAAPARDPTSITDWQAEIGPGLTKAYQEMYGFWIETMDKTPETILDPETAHWVAHELVDIESILKEGQLWRPLSADDTMPDESVYFGSYILIDISLYRAKPFETSIEIQTKFALLFAFFRGHLAMTSHLYKRALLETRKQLGI